MSSEILAYQYGVAVTTSDTVADPAGPFAGIYVGSTAGGSTVVVASVNKSGAVVEATYTNVNAGVVLPVRCIRVKTTGTTATGLLGMVGAT